MINSIEGVLGGGFTFVLALYGYMKYKGLKIFPKEIEDQVKKLEGENANLEIDYKSLETEVYKVLGNVSLAEVGAILKRAGELKAGGYTAEEAQELGQMVLNAVEGPANIKKTE